MLYNKIEAFKKQLIENKKGGKFSVFLLLDGILLSLPVLGDQSVHACMGIWPERDGLSRSSSSPFNVATSKAAFHFLKMGGKVGILLHASAVKLLTMMMLLLLFGGERPALNNSVLRMVVTV